MIFQWYKVFNLNEFNALNLVSYVYTLILDQRGQFDVLVTKGNFVSVVFDGVMLPIQFDNKNPFSFGEYAVCLENNGDVYLGFAVDE